MPSCIIAWLFQSTLPLRGATVALRRDGVIQEHFNPHSPCGERLQQILDKANALLISIHTPLAGSDFSWAEWTPNTTLFQSTLPLRGATEVPAVCGVGDFISIHTPLAGSDIYREGHRAELNEFQSTLPLRGATWRSQGIGPRFVFQSTLPLRGATVSRSVWRHTLDYFNPHSPCGERQNGLGFSTSPASFQSTLPLRGATVEAVGFRIPVWYFNPHSPCGERPQK